MSGHVKGQQQKKARLTNETLARVFHQGPGPAQNRVPAMTICSFAVRRLRQKRP